MGRIRLTRTGLSASQTRCGRKSRVLCCALHAKTSWSESGRPGRLRLRALAASSRVGGAAMTAPARHSTAVDERFQLHLALDGGCRSQCHQLWGCSLSVGGCGEEASHRLGQERDDSAAQSPDREVEQLGDRSARSPSSAGLEALTGLPDQRVLLGARASSTHAAPSQGTDAELCAAVALLPLTSQAEPACQPSALAGRSAPEQRHRDL